MTYWAWCESLRVAEPAVCPSCERRYESWGIHQRGQVAARHGRNMCKSFFDVLGCFGINHQDSLKRLIFSNDITSTSYLSLKDGTFAHKPYRVQTSPRFLGHFSLAFQAWNSQVTIDGISMPGLSARVAPEKLQHLRKIMEVDAVRLERLLRSSSMMIFRAQNLLGNLGFLTKDYGNQLGKAARGHHFWWFGQRCIRDQDVQFSRCRYHGARSSEKLFDAEGHGSMIFEGLRFKLRSEVFVPRGESRHLIQAASRHMAKKHGISYGNKLTCGNHRNSIQRPKAKAKIQRPKWHIQGVIEQCFDHLDLRMLDVTLGVGNGLLPLLKRPGTHSRVHSFEQDQVESYLKHLCQSSYGSVQGIHRPKVGALTSTQQQPDWLNRMPNRMA